MTEIYMNSEAWLRAAMVLGVVATPVLLMAMLLVYRLAVKRRVVSLTPEFGEAIRELVEAQCAEIIAREMWKNLDPAEQAQQRFIHSLDPAG